MSASAGAQATPSRGRSGEQPSPPRASQRATKASQAASGPRRPGRAPGNDEIASVLERVADLLEVQHASAYRVRAYRAGARTIRGLPFPVAERVEERGDASLESLPAIGRSLAALVREYVATSRLGLLERLEGETSPHDLFATVPGIGPALADRIESQLHVETLEDLEAAAHDGRLESVPGFGARRVRAVRDSLASGLRYSAARRARAGPHRLRRPSVRRSGCCSRSIASIASGPRAASSVASRRGASTPSIAPGCPSCTRIARAGRSRPSSRIPLARMSSVARTTGSSSITSATATRGRPPS